MRDTGFIDAGDALASLIAALSQGAAPLAVSDFTGPPPPAEHLLSLMRQMIDESGEAMGCITFGTASESGMLPLSNVDAQSGLRLVCAARLAGVISQVQWVAVAADAYHRIYTDGTDPDSVMHGDLQEMHEAGDPSVTEALMALCYAPDGPSYDVVQPYVRTDGGVEWGEPERLEPDAQKGELTRLMQVVVRA